MDVEDALIRRRMVRSFDGRPISDELLGRMLDAALRTPTAGNARGVSWVLLAGPDEVAQYFEATTDEEWRASSPRSAGLQRASAVAICCADPACYLERYKATDKRSSGLGADRSAWPVPYWLGDAAFSTMALLLLAEEHGLGAAFLGAFRGINELKALLEIPERIEVFGSVLLGIDDGHDHRSRSLDRDGPPRSERIHRGRYHGP